jgi:hypothetical protein
MNIAIVHDGPKHHSLVLTSVVSAILKKYSGSTVTLITGDNNLAFHKFNTRVTPVSFDAVDIDRKFDLVVDYGGSDKAIRTSISLETDKYLGPLSSGFESDIQAFRGIYTDTEVNRSIFQMMFGVAGLKWKGQGYAFNYYPRSRTKKGRFGAAVSNHKLRKYLRSEVPKDNEKLWHIPIRQSVYKQFDEINKCEKIITDDPFVMHAALCLRKWVEYLVYSIPSERLEFFGSGCVHLIPSNLKGEDE